VGLVVGRSLQNDTTSDNTTSSASKVNNNNDDDDDEYTQAQQIALTWSLRIAAMISFLSAIYIFRMAWKRRDHVFHRLMLAQSIHLMMWSPWMVYGAAAVPYGTPDTWGAFGNTATCTAQGFFSQLSVTVPLYYVFLSCYSWVVIVYGNFNPLRYQWIEKYIHIGVHIFPVASACYLLYIEAFNPVAAGNRCWIASVPFGCGDESDIECTRGPQNISSMMWIFASIPMFFSLIFPAIAMIALAIFVYRRNKKGIVPCGITTWMIFKQSVVYLGTFYWIHIPNMVHTALSIVANKKFFILSLVSTMIIMLRGLWYAMVYTYFSISGAPVDGTCVGISKSTNTGTIGNNTKSQFGRREQFASTARGARARATSKKNKNKEDKRTATTKTSIATVSSSMSVIIKDHCQVDDGDDNISTSSSNNNREEEDDNNIGDVERAESSQQQQFSLNIFDGTAPVNSRYSAFIFDGDEEDDEYDRNSSKYFAGCQNA